MLLNRAGIIGRLFSVWALVVTMFDNVLTGGAGDGMAAEESTGCDNHAHPHMASPQNPNIISPQNHLFALSISKIESYA